MEIYDEDTLTEFELGRQRNIIRNYEFMKACGLPVKPLVYVKRVHVPLEEQFKYLTESDESDEEWTMKPKKKKEDKKASKSADIRRKVSNPAVFFKVKEKKERKLKENEENEPASSSTPSSTSPSVGVGSGSGSAAVRKGGSGKHFIRQRPKLPPSTPKTDRYPRRGPRINYSEAEVPDDDNFLFCEQCQEYYQGECSEHCIIRPISDTPVCNGSKKALSSLPEGMEVRESRIKDAGLGVFAMKEFQSGATFGPYEGLKLRADVPKVGLDTSYIWEIVKDLKVAYYINGKNEEHANWMRYVNCARVEEEQNMVAYQFHGNIFYRVYKDVQPGTEFLVWYGEEYARELGIALEGQPTNDETYAVFNCVNCGLCYIKEGDLQRHQRYCRKKPDGQRRGEGKGTATHQCWGCHFVSNSEAKVWIHARVHTQWRPFLCKDCEKSFLYQSSYLAHVRTHSQVPQLRCNICGREFHDDSHFRRHMRSHSGESRCTCDECGQSFSSKDVLKRHTATHSEEKRFQCEVCGYSSTRKDNFERHKKSGRHLKKK